MGAKFGNKEKSIDIGYGGFYNLRKRTAYLIDKKLGKAYEISVEGRYDNKETEKVLNDILPDLINKYGKDKEWFYDLLDFLYDPDAGGKISYKTAGKIYDIIKDYDDDILYGYCGRADCAKFSDYKEIFKISKTRRLIISWN